MKLLIYSCFVSFVFFFASCSNEDVTSPDVKSNESGKVLLKFDKTTAPLDVVTITAYLTKTTGPDTISGTLNLLSDTTASISFQNIPIGDWHLKINAANSQGVIIYSGEADLTVIASMITQVALTLQPSGNASVGGIYILVNWGVNTSAWTDYSHNPVLIPTSSTFDAYGLSSPIVFVDGSSFKMWHTCIAASGVSSVGYAESTDGLTWTRPTSKPVLSPGAYGAWDSYTVGPGPVIKVNGEYWMYYNGSISSMGPSHIGLATSTDGINWTKKASPVIYSQSGWESAVGAEGIIKIGDVYYLYYTGRNNGAYKIGLATSTDGLNWTRYSGNPILSADKSWEGNGVYYPSVIAQNGGYTMFYGNISSYNTAFGTATSTDGKNWVKSSSNPFFTYKNSYSNWTNSINYPCAIKYNNELRVYYTGYSISLGTQTIGLVRK
jgi:predicted GH43/DUF377 family glycosyl hydrolase